MIDKVKPVKAWGIVNSAGDLIRQTFVNWHDAETERINRWPTDGGKSRIVRVIITPEGKHE